MKKQSSSIKKGIICCLSLFCSLSIQAQKLGDYIEIDSVPAFIFYIDNTGKHGLAMSMPAVYSDMLKKIDKYVKKGLIDKRQAELSKKGNVIDIKNYEESGMLKPKNKQKLFENLIPKLTEKGEENAAIIEAYCKEQNILMQEHFPWEYWASQLGQGWFIPGDYYNPQNEMFRLLGTKRSFFQNETFFFSHPYPPYPALFRLISHF